jgi:CubicO group peptidase (beta-lactamase class C family)
MIRFVLAFTLVLTRPLAPSNAAAQPPQPESSASQQLKAWLAAYDAADWNAYLQFLQKNFVTPPGPMLKDPNFRDRIGGFDLRKIENETPTTVTALLQEHTSDRFAQLTLEVDPTEPHRIVSFDIHPVQRPAEFALKPMTEAELIAALRNRLQADVAADKFAGAVLVAKDGKPIFAQAYGLADREHDIPNTLTTRFSIGSMNKMFTGVAVLQLAQAGKLKLDDPLGKYLTNYPNKELAAKVTISDLLTNTGGTGDIWGPEYDKHRLELRTLQDYINLYGSRPLRFEPGSRWEYSNYGFILLGAVIEKVSGESYYDYVRDHIYVPAGMTSTASEPEDPAKPNHSIGYTRMGAAMGTSAWRPTTGTLSYRGSSAGGGYSTVGDLLAFANALRENKLLDPQYTKLLITPHVKNPFGFDAYGFGVQTMNGAQCFGHNGASPGSNGDLEICRDSTYTVIALANMDPPAAEEVSQFVINRLSSVK